MGGLGAAIRLAAAGLSVTVVEAAATPGGKARAVPSVAGPVDTGPTVLTLRAVFDQLFALGGARLEDHLTLTPQPILARHWWDASPPLDLFAQAEANIAAIDAFAGPREAAAFARFDRMSQELYRAFDGPVMAAAKPDPGAIARAALARPRLWPALLPGMTLERLLRLYFRDPRLVQLFARYATYVGGRPARSPGVLGLIWRAEAAGVWAVQGGMHSLAAALARVAEGLGVRFAYATQARAIITQNNRVTGVAVEGGHTLPCAYCVFNGDPAALINGTLGAGAARALPAKAAIPRSLSAYVWAFAATPRGPDLVHHNVFFSADTQAEFGPIGRGQMPCQPTLYVCAQDRSTGQTPTGLERFEIIVNAPAGAAPPPKEAELCHTRTFQRLHSFGLSFAPDPPPRQALTTPGQMATLYPGSQGAIYGRSPEGLMAAFQRPGARTRVAGLYLAGGGAHPGAGVPMAALSGRHAAEAIMQDRISGFMSGQTAMLGGMLTGSATTGRAPFR